MTVFVSVKYLAFTNYKIIINIVKSFTLNVSIMRFFIRK